MFILKYLKCISLISSSKYKLYYYLNLNNSLLIVSLSKIYFVK